MKKILLTLFAALATWGVAFGENLITVSDITVSSSCETALLVNINLSEKASAKSMNFSVDLPEGVEFVLLGGKPVYKSGSIFNVEPTLNTANENKTVKVAIASSNYITGSKGLLIAFKIRPIASFTDGQVLTGGKVYEVSASIKGELVDLSESNFGGTATNRVVLDENSPFAPEATDGNVDILVKRAMTAGEWSTICLPFTISETDVKNIFGDEVEIAYFSNYSSDDNFSTMAINFKAYTKILANRPFIIKASKNISEIRYNAQIQPDAAACVFEYKVGDEIDFTIPGRCWGSYVADFNVPKNNLFISNNTFYYSRGTTRMKAFRAYFDFKDKLKDLNSASTRAFINFGDGTTGIRNAKLEGEETGKVFSMTGQYMGERESLKSLPKGVYIIDGKKVINK